ncbi:hypothetical protein BDV09DRAFT_161125 [Aspergillus tetrazonus]
MMLSAAAARRTSCAFPRNSRTPATLPSRTISFSYRRPLQLLPKPQPSNRYNQFRSQFPTLPRHVLDFPQQTRSLSYFQRTRLGLRQASKGIWRKYPVLLPFAILGVVGSTLFFAYIVYIEVTHNAPQYHKFPPEVVKPLRQAVYYTDVVLQPQTAMKYYKEALKAAAQVGLHPFSDEVLGIKLQVADMLERSGNVVPAVKVLENTKKEILQYVEFGRKRAAEQKKAQDEHKKKFENESKQRHAQTDIKLEIDNPDFIDTYEQMKAMDEYDQQQQDKAMKKAVGISLKLGQLYASDHIQDLKKSEAAHESAIELSMNELKYRQSTGLPLSNPNPDAENELTPWLTRRDAAMALTNLAQTYGEMDKHDLALPVFLRALELLREDEGPKPTAFQFYLLGIIASTLNVQSLKPLRADDPDAARNHLVGHAREWAMTANKIMDKIPDSEKDESYLLGCISVKNTLGQLAERQGELEEAEKYYREAIDTAKVYASHSTVVDPRHEEVVDDLRAAVERVSKR